MILGADTVFLQALDYCFAPAEATWDKGQPLLKLGGGASQRGHSTQRIRNPFNSQALAEPAMAVPAATGAVHYLSEEYSVRPHWVRRIVSFCKVNPELVIDGFSTDSNKRFKLNITEKEDSLAAAWPSGYTMWLNPPWSLFQRVVDKIFEDHVACIVICPA